MTALRLGRDDWFRRRRGRDREWRRRSVPRCARRRPRRRPVPRRSGRCRSSPRRAPPRRGGVPPRPGSARVAAPPGPGGRSTTNARAPARRPPRTASTASVERHVRRRPPLVPPGIRVRRPDGERLWHEHPPRRRGLDRLDDLATAAHHRGAAVEHGRHVRADLVTDPCQLAVGQARRPTARSARATRPPRRRSLRRDPTPSGCASRRGSPPRDGRPRLDSSQASVAMNARFFSGSGRSIGRPSGWNIPTETRSSSRAVTVSASETGSTRLSRSW